MRTQLQKQFTAVLLGVMVPALSFALTLSPSTFNLANLNSITNGTTVYLKPGTYVLNQSLIDAWVAGNKNNVTFKKSNEVGEVIMSGNNFAVCPQVKFNKWNYLKLEDIKFVNLEIYLYDCDNCLLNRLKVEGQKYTGGFVGKSALSMSYGENNTVSNSTVRWTFTGWNGKAIGSWRGVKHKFINNTLGGRLRGGYDLNGYEGDPAANHIIDGGTIKREVSSGDEDHGIYLHDLSGVEVKNITITGFTTTGAGGAIKLKNMDAANLHNCTFNTSGVLLRIETSTWNHLANIWIHDNIFTGPQGINCWMPGYNPKAIRLEGNIICNGTIDLQYDAALVNQYCALAGKSGGVFNNGTRYALNISSAINKSGNYITSSCVKSAIDTEESPFDRSDLENIAVFPTPVTEGILNIKGMPENEQYTLTIINLFGQVVYDQQLIGHGMNVINLSGVVGTGIYMVNISNEKESHTRKIIFN